MRIPDFPKRENMNMENVILELMDSVAKEELALSNLLNSESKKIDAFVGSHLNFPTYPSNKDILEFNRSIHKIVESILMKEWLLYKKLETILGANEEYCDRKEKNCTCEPCE